jgi:hypothetical protein
MKRYEKPKKLSNNPKEEQGMTIGSRFGYTSNLILLMELRKKIMTFRDIIDLPPCDGSASINEVYIYIPLDIVLEKTICKPIIIDSESFNWIRSRGFSLHIGGFSTYKFWCLACSDCWIYFSSLFLDELILWC